MRNRNTSDKLHAKASDFKSFRQTLWIERYSWLNRGLIYLIKKPQSYFASESFFIFAILEKYWESIIYCEDICCPHLDSGGANMAETRNDGFRIDSAEKEVRQKRGWMRRKLKTQTRGTQNPNHGQPCVLRLSSNTHMEWWRIVALRTSLSDSICVHTQLSSL